MAQGDPTRSGGACPFGTWQSGHHGYRFDLEQGVDVEDMRVQPLDRLRRFSAMVLLSAQIVFVISVHWPPNAVLWLRQLGGKLGLTSGREGPLS